MQSTVKDRSLTENTSYSIRCIFYTVYWAKNLLQNTIQAIRGSFLAMREKIVMIIVSREASRV